MNLPKFNNKGMLPQGIFECTFSEAKNLLVNNEKREELWQKLENFLKWIKPMNFFDFVYIDGSFITDKNEPKDIDLVLEIKKTTVNTLSSVDTNVFDHDYIYNNFTLDVYISPNKNDFREFFQYIGVKEGLNRSLDPKDKKGILKVSI